MRRKHKTVLTDLGINLKEDVALAVNAILKTLPQNQRQIQRKAVNTKSESVDNNKRTEISVITTNSIDLQGDVVLPEGIDRTYFNRNPAVCLLHDMDVQAGICQWIKPIDNGLKAQTYYPPRPDNVDGITDWVPDHVFALISAGMMLGKSIGFLALSTRKALPDEIKLHPDWQDAQVIDKSLLLEYSVVVNGMNPDALITAISKGLKFNPALFGMNLKKKTLAERISEIDVQKLVNETLTRMGLDCV